MEKFGSFTDFQLQSVLIYPTSGGNPVSITNLITTFTYFESITAPFVAATLEVVDSGGLLQGLPIQGSEKIEIKVKTNYSEESTNYSFVIWKVANRFAQNRNQAYGLGLISSEALENEVMRVNKKLEGNPESIIKDLLTTTLKTAKTLYSESSKFEVKVLPNRRRPFDIIASLATKSVSPQGTYTSSTTKKDPTKTETKSEGSSEASVSGSGGFFFWETKRGYNFFAVDSLCADKDSPLKSSKLDVDTWGPYAEKLGNQDDGADDRFIIYNSTFTSELDIVESLRKGKYSSLVVFFNHSTCQYEEYVYKIKDSYDNMAHLGGQESITLIPTNQAELSEYPSRIMSVLLDHETWYNDPGIANPEDANATDPSKFADWQKYYAAQAIARYQLLNNQKCSIVIPGNPEICAGDKIDIRLMNKAPNEEAKEKPEDEESSGLYLVEEVTQLYESKTGTNGRFTTTLRLVRDSYGMKDKPSKHGTK